MHRDVVHHLNHLGHFAHAGLHDGHRVAGLLAGNGGVARHIGHGFGGVTDRQGHLADGVGLVLCAVRNLTDGGAGLVGRCSHLACAVVHGTQGLSEGIQ